MPPVEAIIIIVCLLFLYFLDKRSMALIERGGGRRESNGKELPLDQEVIDFAVAHFSREEGRIPEYYISIGPHLSAEFVAERLLDILKPEERRLVRNCSIRYGDEIIRILQEKGIISFNKDILNA